MLLKFWRMSRDEAPAEREMNRTRQPWGRYGRKTRQMEIRAYGPQTVLSCQLIEAYAQFYATED
jgi:hypothetical protein